MQETKKRVTIKISGKTHRKLCLLRKKTGLPIGTLMHEAVYQYARTNVFRRMFRRRTKRGSR